MQLRQQSIGSNRNSSNDSNNQHHQQAEAEIVVSLAVLQCSNCYNMLSP